MEARDLGGQALITHPASWGRTFNLNQNTTLGIEAVSWVYYGLSIGCEQATFL